MLTTTRKRPMLALHRAVDDDLLLAYEPASRWSSGPEELPNLSLMPYLIRAGRSLRRALCMRGRKREAASPCH